MSRIVEAFQAGTSQRIIVKIANVLSRKVGKQITISSIPMYYKNQYGQYAGYFGELKNGTAFRINFHLAQSDYIASIDYYKGYNIIKPVYTVEFERTDNIIQILGRLVDMVNGNLVEDFEYNAPHLEEGGRTNVVAGTIKAFFDADTTYTQYAQTMKMTDLFHEFESWAKSYGVPSITYVSFNNGVKKWMSENGIVSDKIRAGMVKKGVIEGPAAIPMDQEAQEFLDIISGPWQDAYEYLEKVLTGMINGATNGVFVYGGPGTGKSFQVRQVMKKLMGGEPAFFKGSVKGSYELARILYLMRENTAFVFDDFDKVLQDDNCVKLLMSALERRPVRTVTYVDKTKRPKKEQVPSRFDFTSSIVIISNNPKLPPALESRVTGVKVDFTQAELFDIIKDQIGSIMPDVPVETKMEVLELLMKYTRHLKRIDFRQFQNAMVVRLGCTGPDWNKWVLRGLKK